MFVAALAKGGARWDALEKRRLQRGHIPSRTSTRINERSGGVKKVARTLSCSFRAAVRNLFFKSQFTI